MIIMGLVRNWLEELSHDEKKILVMFLGMMIGVMMILGILDHFGIIKLVEESKSTILYFYDYSPR